MTEDVYKTLKLAKFLAKTSLYITCAGVPIVTFFRFDPVETLKEENMVESHTAESTDMITKYLFDH